MNTLNFFSLVLVDMGQSKELHLYNGRAIEMARRQFYYSQFEVEL